MKKQISIFVLIIFMLGFYYEVALAQDTFSICAVDTSNNYVGSAGASCTNYMMGVVAISDVHPNVGVIHTQAWYLPENQNYARTLMNMGLSPQQIIDSLVAHDYQNNPTIRQYGIVDLIGGGRSAAYTGINCPNWKGHLLGQTYAIAGNTLQGPWILDSMRSRFLNTTGMQSSCLLAIKLMAALQGAKVPGADVRCTSTSSLSAFIRVAKPTDPPSGPYWLDISLNLFNPTRDPIDSLQTLFNIWLNNCINGITPISNEVPDNPFLYQNYPNPFNPSTVIKFQVSKLGPVNVTVYDVLGKEIAVLVNEQLKPGTYEVDWNAADVPSGVYYYKLTTGVYVESKKMVIIK